MNRKQSVFRTLFIAAMCIGSSVFFTACSDETKESISQPDPTPENPSPTTDQLGVVYEGKTLLLGDDRTGINASVAARIKNPVSEFSANLASVVLVNGANVKVKVADVPQLVEAYNNYTNFVVVGGRGNQSVAALVDTVSQAIDQLDADGKDTQPYRKFLEGVESARLQLDKDSTDASSVVAFRKNSSFSLPSLDNSFANSRTEDSDSIQFHIVEENYKPNGYRYGLSADNLVAWMKESEGLDNGGNEDEDYGIYSISRSTSLDHVLFACQQNCGVNYKYDIIPLHKFDTDEDYYLFRYELTVKNSELPDPYTIHKGYVSYRRNGEEIPFSYYNWLGTLKYGWLGPILVGLKYKPIVFQSEDGNEDIVIEDPRPRPATGKEYGFDFSMDNINPIQPTVTSYASPTYSYNKKWKVQPIEDLPIITYLDTNPDSSAVDWYYCGTMSSYAGSNKINRVPDYQTNDFTIGFSWIAKIKNPKQGVCYRFTALPVMYYQEICADDPDKSGRVWPFSPADWLDYTVNNFGQGTKGYKLPEPNRSRTSYKIVIDCDNYSHEAWVKKTDVELESELGFSSQKPVYSYAKTDAEGQEQAIKAFNQYIEKLTLKSKQSGLWFKANVSLVRTDNNSNDTLCQTYVDNMD